MLARIRVDIFIHFECGKTGTYSFRKVGKGSYWLFIKGGNAKCYKSAKGKVQNK